MKPVTFFGVVLICGVFLSAMSLRSSDQGVPANPDIGNSWVATKSASSFDFLFSKPLPAQRGMDPRIDATWKRHSFGLPVKWIVIDHSLNYEYYYGRIDVRYCIVSLAIFTSLSTLVLSFVLWIRLIAFSRR